MSNDKGNKGYGGTEVDKLFEKATGDTKSVVSQESISFGHKLNDDKKKETEDQRR